MWNLGLLVVIVFPVWFVALGISAYLNTGTWARDWPGGWGGLLYIFLNMSVPLIAGGAVQQFLLLPIPKRWPAARRRFVAVLSTIVILPSAFVFGGVWALIPGLLLYGLALRLPRDSDPLAA